MFQIEKKYDYLICINSDGTIMDSMVLKHENAFGPALIKTFNLEEIKDEVLEIWYEINLKRITRGINRFKALDLVLKEIETKFGKTYDGYDQYHDWVLNSDKLSIDLLSQKVINTENKNCLELALKWAELANLYISNQKYKPFNNSLKVLDLLYDSCDLVGVSSANNSALNSEWQESNISKYFRVVASQEYGNKEKILESAIRCGYDLNKSVMIGDSMSDYEAAKKVNMLFFPIIPTKENESWDLFLSEGIVKLKNNTFDDKYQKKLVEQLKKSLK